MEINAVAPDAAKTRKREDFSWTRRLHARLAIFLILVVVIVTTAVGLYVHKTLVNLTETLPVTVVNQERDLQTILDAFSDTLAAVEAARRDPTPTHIDHALDGIDATLDMLVTLRATYNFDNLIGASAIHATVDPALNDMRQWLSYGVSGYPPHSDTVLGLTQQRAMETDRIARDLFDRSNAIATDLLLAHQSDLSSVRVSLLSVMALTAILAPMSILLLLWHQRAESRAITAQARLGEAIESIPDGFVLYDPWGHEVMSNRRHRALYHDGRKLPGVVRSQFGDCQASDANEPPATYELDRGDDRWLRVSERRMPDGSLVGISTEITELKRRERELAENSALLSSTFNTMAEGLCVFDGSLRLRTHNQRLVELLDLPESLFDPGTHISEWYRHHEDSGGTSSGPNVVELSICMDRSHRFELLMPDQRIIEVQTTPMNDGAGFVALYSDVSLRRKSEQTLRQAKEQAEMANRSKTEFLANISHELRTPLNAIIGFSDIIRQQMFGALGNDRYADYAEDIHASGRHLLSVINDLLDLSKIEAGQLQPQETAVSLADIVYQSRRIIDPRVSDADLDLTDTCRPDLPLIYADPRMLKQVMLNLLSNAVKFTEPGGSITIGADRTEQGLRISVTDTGIGMDPDKIPKALSPFGQIEGALNRRHQGTGLGLPLVKSLVAMHDGTLTIQSAPGAGTTVAIHLPLSRLIEDQAYAPAPVDSVNG